MSVRFILPVTIRKRFSLLQAIEDINVEIVRMLMMHYRTFWILFTSDLVISYTYKLLVFRWVQIVLICFYFAMKEISSLLFLVINQTDIIEAFNSTSRYLDDLLNIDNPYFEGMVNQIYPPELQLNKANTSDTRAPFFGFASFYF